MRVLVFRAKLFFYFLLFEKKRERESGHLMSVAITDDISKPVCLSQDRKNLPPSKDEDNTFDPRAQRESVR